MRFVGIVLAEQHDEQMVTHRSMSAGSLARLAPVGVVELDSPEEVIPQLMTSLSISEADGAELLIRMKVKLWTVTVPCGILAPGAGD